MTDRIEAMVERIRSGSRIDIARAITVVESSRADHREITRDLLARLRPFTGGAVRVGISGVPGAGKSTFVDAMGTRLVERGHKVAVLAIDPSSSRTGGSILGDRTRMARLTQHENAFVRPSPSGRHLGGVARATRESMLVLEAAGYDVVLVETVGVGQSEVAVAEMVDTFLLIALSRAGDQLQGIKRGILELAEVIAINKADGDNAPAAKMAARELSGALRLMASDPGARKVPVLTCSALTGDGLDDVWQEVLDHRAHLEGTGVLHERRATQQRSWMWALVESGLTDALYASPQVVARREELEKLVVDGTLSAVEASAQVLDLFVDDLRAGGASVAP